MEEDKIHRMFVKKTCPVCGEKFYPAPMHSYKVGNSAHNKLVCSYSCMRKYEREHGHTDFYQSAIGKVAKKRRYVKKNKEDL